MLREVHPRALIALCCLALLVPAGAASGAAARTSDYAQTDQPEEVTSTSARLVGQFKLPCSSDFGFRITRPDGTVFTQEWQNYVGFGYWRWVYSGLTPGSSYTYVAFSGGCNGNAEGNPVTFTTLARLHVTVAGSGSVFGVNTTCDADCSIDLPNAVAQTFTATAKPGFIFVGWTGICAGQGAVCSAAPSGDASLSASFGPGFALNVARSGDGAGTVTSSPGGIACGGTCAFGFLAGTKVTLTAAPADGSAFTGWTGDCSGSSPTCTVSIDAARSVTAAFVKENKLGVGVHGKGSVSSQPDGIDCGAVCSALFPPSASVTLTPSAADGWAFTGWQGACTGADACTVEMSQNAVVQAFFAPLFGVTVLRAGKGRGTVSAATAGISCGTRCKGQVVRGTKVTLRATAAKGSRFSGWTRGCANAKPTCVVTVNRPTTVRAVFQPR